MAGYAMQHAEFVAQNITAQVRDEQPTATYRPLPHPMILLPLGPRGGAGQLPTPDGPAAVPAATVSQYKAPTASPNSAAPPQPESVPSTEWAGPCLHEKSSSGSARTATSTTRT